ncbi:hypothetical protein TNCV_2869651 [Trichonephila clavipes]|nr:hypothetical protein TNCV_2869651 [Trichonephila clavipes]
MSDPWLPSDWLVNIRQSLRLTSCDIVLKLNGHLYLYMPSNLCFTQFSGLKKAKTHCKHLEGSKSEFQRNPRVSMRQIARDMGISDRSVKRIAKTELGLKLYK